MRLAADFVNHVLGQHAWARARLAEHAGKTIRIDAPPLSLDLLVGSAGDVSAAVEPGAGGVVFRIDPAAAPLLLSDPESAMRRVHLEGDAELASLVALLLREVRWDVEEDLSRFVGDVPAYQAMRMARALAGWARDAQARLTAMTGAYLADEAPVLVRRSALEELADGVADARDACARLEKRIESLEARRRAPPTR